MKKKIPVHDPKEWETNAELMSARIFTQATKNTEKWGVQDVPDLILAMLEELGEISQAHLQAEHEGGDPGRIYEEAKDLGALCLQLGALLREPDYCHGCNNHVDKHTCHCGESPEGHGRTADHSFVPMGCTCGYAKKPDCPDKW